MSLWWDIFQNPKTAKPMYYIFVKGINWEVIRLEGSSLVPPVLENFNQIRIRKARFCFFSLLKIFATTQILLKACS